MTALRERMIQDMQIRNLSPRTIECYVYHVACFAKYFGRSPEELGPEQVRLYQVYLVQQKHASWSSFNQAVCALRFLYGTTLGRSWPVTQIPFAKKPKKLPVVLGPDEVRRLLACVRPLPVRLLLSTIYAAGLRLAEARHLRVPDIDSPRMQLRVQGGKGAKDRVLPLSPRLLEQLRAYWRMRRPQTWLFPGAKPERPISDTVVQQACKRAAAEAGISKRVSPHTLRHSYATALMETGVDLLTIQQLLGHGSFTTTLVYLHVRGPRVQSLASPLDLLPLPAPPASPLGGPATAGATHQRAAMLPDSSSSPGSTAPATAGAPHERAATTPDSSSGSTAPATAGAPHERAVTTPDSSSSPGSTAPATAVPHEQAVRNPATPPHVAPATEPNHAAAPPSTTPRTRLPQTDLPRARRRGRSRWQT